MGVSSYDVVLYYQPNIASLQTICEDDDNRELMSDWLIKAVIPVLTSVTIVIKNPNSLDVDTEAIQQAVTDVINSQSFVPELSSSLIVDAAQSLLPSTAYIDMPIEMIGSIIMPDRSVTYLRSTNELVVPEELELGVSGNTSAFFTSAELIGVISE